MNEKKATPITRVIIHTISNKITEEAMFQTENYQSTNKICTDESKLLNFNLGIFKKAESKRNTKKKLITKLNYSNFINQLEKIQAISKDQDLNLYFQSYNQRNYLISENFCCFSYLTLEGESKQNSLLSLNNLEIEQLKNFQTDILYFYQNDKNHVEIYQKQFKQFLLIKNQSKSYHWECFFDYKASYTIKIPTNIIFEILEKSLLSDKLFYFIFHRQKLTLCQNLETIETVLTLPNKIPNGVLKLPIYPFTQLKKNFNTSEYLYISFENFNSPVKITISKNNFSQILMPYNNGAF